MPLTESQKSKLKKMDADSAIEEAYRMGCEAAANVCDEQAGRARTSPGSARASACADLIRALASTLKGEQHG